MLDLNEQEMRALLDALDLAVRTNGLRAAVIALPLAAKIEQAMLAEQADKDD